MIKKRPAHVPSGRHNPTPPAKVINFYKHALQNLKAGGLRKFRKPYQAVMTVATPARGRDNTADYNPKPKLPRICSLFLRHNFYPAWNFAISFQQGSTGVFLPSLFYRFKIPDESALMAWPNISGPPDTVIPGAASVWNYNQENCTKWLELWNASWRHQFADGHFFDHFTLSVVRGNFLFQDYP